MESKRCITNVSDRRKAVIIYYYKSVFDMNMPISYAKELLTINLDKLSPSELNEIEKGNYEFTVRKRSVISQICFDSIIYAWNYPWGDTKCILALLKANGYCDFDWSIVKKGKIIDEGEWKNCHEWRKEFNRCHNLRKTENKKNTVCRINLMTLRNKKDMERRKISYLQNREEIKKIKEEMEKLGKRLRRLYKKTSKNSFF